MKKLISKVDLGAGYVLAAATGGCAMALFPGREVPYFFAPTVGNIAVLGVTAILIGALTAGLQWNASRG